MLNVRVHRLDKFIGIRLVNGIFLHRVIREPDSSDSDRSSLLACVDPVNSFYGSIGCLDNPAGIFHSPNQRRFIKLNTNNQTDYTDDLTFPGENLPNDVVVAAKHLDQVENPREFEILWKQVINTPIIRTIADAVVSYYTGCVGCTTAVIEFVDTNVLRFSDAGEEHTGEIESPAGYTVCYAYVTNPSVNCNGTFIGQYRTADDPANTVHVDGLAYYMVVPRPGAFAGRCWVEGTVVVTFARATPNNPYRAKCARTGEIAFHYGK